MFDIFNRKKIKELEERLEKINDHVKVLDESLRVCERIIKYAKDEPNFNIYYDYKKEVHVLYLYINREEYIIELEELHGMIYCVSSGELSIKDGLAVFTVPTKYGNGIHKFTIDYKAGKYISNIELAPVAKEENYDRSSNENISNN